MRSARREGEAGKHPTSTDHVRWPTQTAHSGEIEGKNRVPCALAYIRLSTIASGGVTFMRAASIDTESAYLLHRMLALRPSSGQTSAFRSPSPLQRTQKRKRGAS